MNQWVVRFQVIAPSYIAASGEPFDVTIRALDSNNHIVQEANGDVLVSSGDPYLVFATNKEEPFTPEIHAPLVMGEAHVWAKDSKASGFTLFVEDGEHLTGSKTIQFDFTTLKVTYYDYEPPPGTGTLDHYRFYDKRIDVNSPTPPVRESEDVEGDEHPFTGFGLPELRVFEEDNEN